MSTNGGKGTWMCLVCGFVYDADLGVPEAGVRPGTPWDDLPDDWRCPSCGASKRDFFMDEP